MRRKRPRAALGGCPSGARSARIGAIACSVRRVLAGATLRALRARLARVQRTSSATPPCSRATSASPARVLCATNLDVSPRGPIGLSAALPRRLRASVRAGEVGRSREGCLRDRSFSGPATGLPRLRQMGVVGGTMSTFAIPGGMAARQPPPAHARPVERPALSAWRGTCATPKVCRLRRSPTASPVIGVQAYSHARSCRRGTGANSVVASR